MKRFTLITLSIVILLAGSLVPIPVTIGGYTSGSAGHDRGNLSSVAPDQAAEDLYYPIFVGIDSNDTFTDIRPRNNSLGEGGIVKVTARTNVTFRYAVALHNTSTFSDVVDFRLFADLPIVNTTNFNNTESNTELSLTQQSQTLDLEYTGENETDFINYTQPFDGSVISNATLYYYDTTVLLNMSVSYLPFYVRDVATDGLNELDGSEAYNLLSTTQYFNTSSQDEFYIQEELVNITGSLYFGDASVDTLGIEYQIDGGSDRFKNYTLTYTGNNGTDTISLGPYEPGTIITWSSIYYTANDTLLNISRSIPNIDVKEVDVGDGTPNLNVVVDPNHPDGLLVNNKIYTQSLTINFSVTTDVPKGNITSVKLFGNDTDQSGFTFSPVNGSLSDVILNKTVTYSDDGTYNATVSTVTDKGLSINATFVVVIDRVVPDIATLNVEGGNVITTSDGEVTFTFEYSDVGQAGVKMAILDLGNGVSFEVTGMDSFTYRYELFDGNVYEYTLTVIDKAGNLASDSSILELSASQIERNRAPAFAIVLFFVVLIALLISPWWGPIAVEYLRDRFQ